MVKPHIKLLVSPKDKIKPERKCTVIYDIPCLSYIHQGEGEITGTWKKEHQKECEKETANTKTKAIKAQAQQKKLKSVISDHCKRQNIMDWNNARIISAESNKY